MVDRGYIWSLHKHDSGSHAFVLMILWYCSRFQYKTLQSYCVKSIAQEYIEKNNYTNPVI